MKKIALVMLLLVLASGLVGCPWWHDRGHRHDGHRYYNQHYDLR